MSKAIANEFERIMDKVQKLLSRTEENGCSKDEAEQSFKMAHELMARYNMSMNDLPEGAPKQKIGFGKCEHKWDAKWRLHLSNAVANNFRVKTFLNNGITHFYGFEADVRMAVKVFNAAYKYIYKNATKAYNEVYKAGGNAKGIMHSYALGFIHGLKAAWDSQSVALMVVTPPEVTKAFSEYSEQQRFKTITRSLRQSRTQDGSAAYKQGKRDGENFGSVKKISE